ncbi:hypothetical protein ACU4GI_00070 [Cupriavidus basilensis]|uniref:hypothetical protein n=1 Tax=unclassified Cupriavidus TaxID=2640874 RepID=UPI00044A441F|nr:hypothetical protein [Cupriavidus sp. SK-3]KDP88089.1 hypothetical protein CF70_033460 [Cupriavidus sp. SK-3]
MLLAALVQAEERPTPGNAGLGWNQPESDPYAQVASNAPPSSEQAAGNALALPPQIVGSDLPDPPAPAARLAVEDTQPPLVASIGKWAWTDGSPPPGAYNDAPGPSAGVLDPIYAGPANGPRPAKLSLHLDDVTSATGFVGNRMQSMAVALDTVLPRSGGLTIQPRLQLAYQPAPDRSASGFLAGQQADASAAEVVLRVYRTQPSRLTGVNGVYPFVEADLWQDRKQVININGTRIDPDMLRGLLSVNLGAHGSTNGGVKLWVKLKAGRNPGGTLGARYRW